MKHATLFLFISMRVGRSDECARVREEVGRVGEVGWRVRARKVSLSLSSGEARGAPLPTAHSLSRASVAHAPECSASRKHVLALSTVYIQCIQNMIHSTNGLTYVLLLAIYNGFQQ